MQEKHEQLGEFGAIPEAPNGPPTGVPQASSLPVSVPENLAGKDACGTSEKSEQKCAFLEVHDLARLFPIMNDAEFADLKADIEKNGLREPLWTYQGKVIDGRNRLRACQELGITPATREWNGDGSPLDFVVSLNLHRRHLNETQRAMVAARLKQTFEKDAKKRSLQGKELDPRENFPTGRLSEAAGRLLNVSYKSVDFASKVIQHGCPELIALVDSSELPVSKAATIATLQHGNQRDIIKEGLPFVFQIARELEEEARDARRKKKHGNEAPPEPPKTLDFGLIEAKFDGKRYRIEVGDDWPDILKRAVSDWTSVDRAIDYGGVIIVKKKSA